MSLPIPIFATDTPCDEAVAEVTRQLQEASFRVVRTFDLRVAREPYAEQVCDACPHHGHDSCSCQMVILLIYDEGQQPVSLVAHGRDNRTLFNLVASPNQNLGTHTMIRRTLAQ